MTCKHDWHFIAENALQCQRCGAQTGPQSTPQEPRTEDPYAMPLFDDWPGGWNESTPKGESK